VLGVPLSILADRTSRSSVIAVRSPSGVRSRPCASTATSFWQLFLYRLGVGVGEAGESRRPTRSSPTIFRRIGEPGRLASFARVPIGSALEHCSEPISPP
jgi:hypothetical protein